jgi:hypothetical protein
MKRALLILLTLLILFPAGARAQDGLTPEQIEQIADSVVMIVTYNGSRPIGSGSGTIVTRTGAIFTNQHVVDEGDDFRIYLLEDLNEKPVHAYYARVDFVLDEMDFAILQIDRDDNGRAVNPNDLDLPFLPYEEIELVRGDHVYVFGYPDIGDGYLVLTEGKITTIQNGSVGGERMPVWYQTDAEISPGNSGGLAVNAEGRFIGIPTSVNSEERTMGRLGGLIPLTSIIRMAGIGEGIDAPANVEKGEPSETEKDAPSLTYGPYEGDLIQDDDPYLETYWASVDMRDFIAWADFSVSGLEAGQDWDFGFMFRNSDVNEDLRLIVTSQGEWRFYDGTSVLIASGDASSFKPSEPNTLFLLAYGDEGIFYLNGGYVTTLDLSARMTRGDFAVATGFFEGTENGGVTTEYADFEVRALSRVFGPEDGSLPHDDDDSIEYAQCGINEQNFVAAADFYVPYGTRVADWDAGMLFRDNSGGGISDEYRLVFASDGYWAVIARSDESNYLADGTTNAVRTGAEDMNRLMLLAEDDFGIFFINGELISSFKLPESAQPGDIAVATGFYPDSEVAGSATAYRNFTVWAIP